LHAVTTGSAGCVVLPPPLQPVNDASTGSSATQVRLVRVLIPPVRRSAKKIMLVSLSKTYLLRGYNAAISARLTRESALV
jgi:hypothetical protein